jgi:adenylate kinase
MGLNVIMMGPPGAGKGTQAARFARERGLLKISTGDILRDAIKAGMPVAVEAKRRMDLGELVEDSTMIAIVRERLLRPDAVPGFVLDGFPRTVAQATALDRIIAERENGPLVVVDVVVPEEELVRRLSLRRICSSCGINADPFGSGAVCTECGGEMVQRTDDSQNVVLGRLKVHARDTQPVLEFYRERATFRVVDGAQGPERVAIELDRMIDDAASSAPVLRSDQKRR